MLSLQWLGSVERGVVGGADSTVRVCSALVVGEGQAGGSLEGESGSSQVDG